MMYPFAVFSGTWLADGVVIAPEEEKVNPWYIGTGLPVPFTTRAGKETPAGIMIWLPALVVLRGVSDVVAEGSGVGRIVDTVVAVTVGVTVSGICDTADVVATVVGVASGVAEVVCTVVAFTGRVAGVAVTGSVAEGMPDESLPTGVTLADRFETDPLDCAKVPAPASRIPIRKKTSAARDEGKKAQFSIHFVIF
jgi:hypothetical protein